MDNQRKKRTVKNTNLNIKVPNKDKEELEGIASELGGMSLSQMIRTVIYDRLNKVRKSGEPKDFLESK